MSADATPLRIAVPGADTVSALALEPAGARAAYVFAHGAGAGMTHLGMSGLAEALAAAGVATLRFQFPYMERGSKRPDLPPLAHAAVRAACDEAARLWPALPRFAGGRSFGGRMTSQAQASSPLAGIRGLAFVGFPLHPSAKPGIERAAHLSRVQVPMLFMAGTRDELADMALLRGVLQGLGDRATLEVVDDADHSFHVRAKSGRNDAQVREAMAATMAAWFVAR